MRRLLLLAVLLVSFVSAGTAGATASAQRSWAAPQIESVVEAGLMGPSVAEFRPDDPLTEGELVVVLASLGLDTTGLSRPSRAVTVRELDAYLVTALGLRSYARDLRLAVLDAGLSARQWLGTETVARLLGLRVNHPRTQDALELQVSQPATRAEAAYSLARVLTIRDDELEAVREAVSGFVLPELTALQRAVLDRALRFVGSPYVWAGTSERPQRLFDRVLPGGFDCSGFVWRVFKVEAFAGAATLASVLQGRTTYDMSGEVPRPARVPLQALQPADVVFFGARGPRSLPREVGHMGIYVGNGWMVHSSDRGTTLAPMAGWYEARFAWGRNLLSEAGLS